METTDVVDRVDPVDRVDQTNQTDQEVDDLDGDLLKDQHTDGDIHDQSILVPTGFAPAPDVRQLWGRVEDRFAEHNEELDVSDKANLVDSAFNFRPEAAYGESSKKLLSRMTVNYGSDGKVIGANFDGKIAIKWVSKKDGYKISDAKKSESVVKSFIKYRDRAKKEYNKNSNRANTVRAVEGREESGQTESVGEAPVAENIGGDLNLGASTSEEVGGESIPMGELPGESLATDAVVREVENTVEEEVAERIETGIDNIEREMTELNIPDRIYRQVAAVFALEILKDEGEVLESNMKALDANIVFLKNLVEEAAPESREKNLFEHAVGVSELVRDHIRMRDANLRPETEEVQNIVDEAVANSDELRLERFKRWAKENIAGISAVAISAAGLITGITAAARGALKTVAGGLGKFAGALARVLKKLGPVFAALGSLVSTALSWGAKGILWMANNLWFMVIMVLAALYAEYGRRRSAK